MQIREIKHAESNGAIFILTAQQKKLLWREKKQQEYKLKYIRLIAQHIGIAYLKYNEVRCRFVKDTDEIFQKMRLFGPRYASLMLFEAL